MPFREISMKITVTFPVLKNGKPFDMIMPIYIAQDLLLILPKLDQTTYPIVFHD
jgi:hypothetical protein